MFVGIRRRLKGYQKREVAAYVSINKRGEIVVNPAAWELLGKANYVQLFYDEETRRIAIGWRYPIDYGIETFRLRRYGRGRRLRIIYARRLLKQFGIDIDETLVFRDLKVEAGQMLILELEQKGSPPFEGGVRL